MFGALPSDHVVLCLPPLFEEMNLSRAVIAKQAQYFAEHGLITCVMDYFGTGDSEGETDDADVSIWLNDILEVASWLKSRGVQRLTLWGVRFGGLMLLHFQDELHKTLPVCQQLLWKPLLSGELFVKQFIRLKNLNSVLKGDEKKIDWRQNIREGNATEIAGYPLNQALLQSIESLAVTREIEPRTHIVWMELAATQPGSKVVETIERWPVDACTISPEDTPAFWQRPDIFTVAELYPRSLALVRG